MALQILIPAILLGVMAILFGAGLAVAGRIFAVKTDPRIPKVRECLPGANCGGCGYAGCDDCAAKIVNGEAPVTACPVGGDAASKKIADIMGVQPVEGVRMVATIICGGDNDHCKTHYEYDGPADCRAAALASAGPKSCRFACIGFGTCVAACPFDAISLKNGIASIDAEKCHACKKCISVCPKSVIRLEPYHRPTLTRCRAVEKGKTVRDACTAGCIACGRCAKGCKFGAIEMVNNLPVIDYEKCVGCMECAAHCPTGALWGDLSHRLMAKIDQDLCVGCTLCAKQCQFNAIEGELKQKHHIVPGQCTGCGQCAQKCPKKAITLVPREKA